MRQLAPGRLVLATHNPGKVVELAELLNPHGLDVVSAGELGLPEPDETEDSFIGNARLKALAADPLELQVAAISCGIYNGTPVLDLDYVEDSAAGTDANFVLTNKAGIVEVQGTAEGEPFDEENLLRLLRLARIGCNQVFAAQLQAVGR